MFQPGWAVQSTSKKKAHAYLQTGYKDVVTHLSWRILLPVQCNALTHTPPQHNHTDTPEPLREGRKVLPDDFPKVQINLCTLSITKFCGLTLLLQLLFSRRRRKRAMPHQSRRYQPFLYLVRENSYIPLMSSTDCCVKNKTYLPCGQAKQ